MADRYIVREVRGMSLGAGGFMVTDTQEGRDMAPVLWRDDAEKTAARLNAMHRAEQDAPGVPGHQVKGGGDGV